MSILRNSTLRRVLRRPGFMLGSSLILGLSLAANVAAFAILYGYLIRPLPYVAPEELLVPREQVLKWHLLGPQVSPHFFQTVRQLPQFHNAALWASDEARVELNGTSTLEPFGRVTPSVFSLLGAKPLFGRTLSVASGRPGGPREIVLSYAFWSRAFGASPRALGLSLQVDGQTLQIVGVMPPSFVFPGTGAAFWVPFVMTPELAKSENINPYMLIRRPPGWTMARVESLLRSAHDRDESPAQRTRDRESGYMIDAVPYRTMLLDDVGGSAPFWGLWAATLALLIVAVVNALNLALARQRKRTGELQLREVLGGTAGALVRVVLVEYTPILLMAAGVAAALAGSIVRVTKEKGLTTPSLPFHVAMDATALAYLAGLAVMAIGSLAAATLAAVLLGRRRGIALQELGTRSSAGRAFKRTQAVLAAAQIGIALVLAISSVLCTRSLIALLGQPLHYEGTRVTVVQVLLPDSVSPAQFWSRARAVFNALPGVRSAALSSMMPFSRERAGGVFQPSSNRHAPVWAWTIAVSPRFFATLGIHPLMGRVFRPTDEADGASVVLVSEALAREFFGNENAVGKILDGNMRIVGVVPTVPWKLDPREDKHGYAVYFPLTREAILKMIIREIAVLFAAGAMIGVMAAFIAARVLRSELYGVGTLDPLAYLGSVTLVGASVLIAALLPALRATRSSPAEIMRR